MTVLLKATVEKKEVRTNFLEKQKIDRRDFGAYMESRGAGNESSSLFFWFLLKKKIFLKF